MGVAAFPASYPPGQGGMTNSRRSRSEWVGMAAGGTFLAGGLLLLSGKKKAGLLMTAAAMAVTLVDQKETVREWWNTLPGYLDDAQRLLEQASRTIDDLAAKRDKLRSMFNR